MILLNAIECTKLRNQIVHEGERARKTDEDKFSSIISCIRSLYPQVIFKFPSIEARQRIEP